MTIINIKLGLSWNKY